MSPKNAGGKENKEQQVRGGRLKVKESLGEM
jgi:hypothetical protein